MNGKGSVEVMDVGIGQNDNKQRDTRPGLQMKVY
jgi:hypothetical protein